MRPITNSDKQDAEFKSKTIAIKPAKTQTDFFELNTSNFNNYLEKKTKFLEKKSIDTQTKYLNIPLVL